MKYFIITVDTEGDNLWGWREGTTLTTENVLFVPRFQELCETFGFIPTYMTNYEMAMEKRWIDYAKPKQLSGKCEIGYHIHAWNTPPLFDLPKLYRGKSFITEYPHEVAFEKMRYLKNLLEDRFECSINASRSGRFGTDDFYFETLSALDMHIDCSITPQIDLSGTPGRTVPSCNNYMDADIFPNWIHKDVLEVPLTSRKREPTVERSAPYVWMRESGATLEELLGLVDQVESEGGNCVEFMIHSSEMMPGGSPYYTTAEDIEKLYQNLKKLFTELTNRGYTGTTLTAYGKTGN